MLADIRQVSVDHLNFKFQQQTLSTWVVTTSKKNKPNPFYFSKAESVK